MLRVQRYVNEIDNIINKTKVYGRELGIVGKYLKTNITNNIRNYIEMICERNEISIEELTILVYEFSQYLDYDMLDEYNKYGVPSLKNTKKVSKPDIDIEREENDDVISSLSNELNE
ncbi:MAG TPA: hypothetical protein GXX53_03380 [Tissierellia bacterium]|nr:hypothetical protein [Tissierellia bacterium]